MPSMNMDRTVARDRTTGDIEDGYLLLMLKGSKVDKEALAKSTSSRSKSSGRPKCPPKAMETTMREREILFHDRLREYKLLELLRSQNEERMRYLYPRTSLNSGLVVTSMELRNYLNNLAVANGAPGNSLSYHLGSDELLHRRDLFQQGSAAIRAAVAEAAVSRQLGLLRPLSTLERATKPKTNVCITPPLPSSPIANRDSQDFSSSLTSLPTLVPTSDKIPLPQWFKESKTTVVIGKGHLPRKTPGNHLLRKMVTERLDDYRQTNRRGRALIVSDIYTAFQLLNKDGRYFGNFTEDGEWYEAKEHSARDKIAATFRDCLSHLYKSSTKSKVDKRRKRKAEAAREESDSN